MRIDDTPIDRLMAYWRGLLSIKPTGNAMVDDGTREELRMALRDALHEMEGIIHSVESMAESVVRLEKDYADGAAITLEPCMRCGEMQTYGSTNTDALCLPCAKETGLCKHCGGDLALRERRKTWPTSNVADEKP